MVSKMSAQKAGPRKRVRTRDASLRHNNVCEWDRGLWIAATPDVQQPPELPCHNALYLTPSAKALGQTSAKTKA